MDYKDRQGNVISANDGQDRIIKYLYETSIGRKLLETLIQPWISRMAGAFLETHLSRALIPLFVKKHSICLEDYEKEQFDSYNDFFTRKLLPGKRTFPEQAEQMGAPCDSKLSIYPITERAEFSIKNTVYTMESLTHSQRAAEYYQGGYLMVFRLTVDDYHRYAYVDDGKKTKNYRIPGVFHTVNPLAGEHYPIYKENTREISFLKSKHFGTVMMMEVGALLVGRIFNFHNVCQVQRGQEKGLFEFGGSTVVLAVAKDAIVPDQDILDNTAAGYETIVRMGERIAVEVCR